MQPFYHFLKLTAFFLLGASATTTVIVFSTYLAFSYHFQDKVYPGVKINNLDVSNKTISQVKTSLSEINPISNFDIIFTSPSATLSASSSELNIHLDTDMMTARAFSIGRQTPNPYYNFLQIISSWQGKINLPLEISLDSGTLNGRLDTIAPKIEKPAIDAVFKFEQNAGPDRKGRVVAFIPSENGLAIDREKIHQEIISGTKGYLTKTGPRSEAPSPETRRNVKVEGSPSIVIPIYTKTLSPNVHTSTADDMGIKSLLGKGESYFYDSIPGRVYNIGLGTNKITGSLIAPNEIFSFNQAIGTVSAVFGFAKAYVIKEGKTVLDDGGGVCQVSTTLYRAALNAGLPILERAAHTYRVGFYEQGGFLPGLDATVFPPSPDLKFKNDTGSYLLLQASFDPSRSKLTFDIFGTSDGRQTTILGPYILSTSPAPEPIYEDDPTLQTGQVKQIDQAHPGARVYFKRKVVRGPEVLIDETVNSNFIPWPARFLRGTKS